MLTADSEAIVLSLAPNSVCGILIRLIIESRSVLSTGILVRNAAARGQLQTEFPKIGLIL
jgi:hypothetical protein